MNPTSPLQPNPEPATARRTPVRPAFRPFRSVPSTDPNPYRVEAMPRFWRWHTGIFAVSCFAALGLSAWSDVGYSWVIPLVVGVAVGWHISYRTRCPQCRRLLRARRLVLGPEHYLFMYDCSHCRVSWNSGYEQTPGGD